MSKRVGWPVCRILTAVDNRMHNFMVHDCNMRSFGFGFVPKEVTFRVILVSAEIHLHTFSHLSVSAVTQKPLSVGL